MKPEQMRPGILLWRMWAFQQMSTVIPELVFTMAGKMQNARR